MTERLPAALSLRESGIFYALILLLAGLALLSGGSGRPFYLSPDNVGNILYQASLIGIMAVAMTVMLISGAFDLSVASVAALAAAVLLGLADLIGFAPAMAAAMATALAIGLLNGSVVQFVGINAFIVTLGTLTAVRSLVLVLTDGRSIMVADPAILQAMMAFEGARVAPFWLLIASGLACLGGAGACLRRRQASLGLFVAAVALLLAAVWLGRSFTVASTVLYLIFFTGAVWFVLRFTIIGRRLYAVGGNAEAARLSGIDVNGYKMGAFLLSSGAAGFAGILFGCRLGAVNPTALQGAELTVIAAAILGGTSLFGGAGSVVKSVVGALLLFTLGNGFNVLNLGANYQGLIEGTVVIVAAAIYTLGAESRPGRRRGRNVRIATPALAE